MSPTEERPYHAPHGVNDAYFAGVMTRVSALGAGILVLAVVLLVKAWGPAVRGPYDVTHDRMTMVGQVYRGYLVFKEESFEFDSQEVFVARMSGDNRRKVNYWRLIPADYLDAERRILDAWGRPLGMKRLEGTKIEVRSAGRDGLLGTGDDLVRVLPQGDPFR